MFKLYDLFLNYYVLVSSVLREEISVLSLEKAAEYHEPQDRI